jgi:two-component system sensor histidine kinase HydH
MLNTGLKHKFQIRLADYFFRAKVILGCVLIAFTLFVHTFQFLEGIKPAPVIGTLLAEMALFLFYFFLRRQKPEWVLPYNAATLFVDVLAITVALHFTGGVYSMMWSFAYLLLLAVASLFFSRRGRILYAVYIFLAYSSLFHFERTGVVPRHNIFRVPESFGLDLFCWASTVLLIVVMALVAHNYVELLGRFQTFANLGLLSTELAHEIRTPLQVIEAAVQRQEFPATLRREVQAQTERIARFIREMLAFGRTETRRVCRVPVRELLDSSVGLVLKGMSDLNGIEITKDYPSESLWVEADPDQLAKAFSNLVRNGLDSLDGKGNLKVSLSRDGFEWLRVDIRDTGRGIDRSEFRKIFEPFYTTKSGRRGAGLGLAIAKKFVEANGGRIEVRSRPREGSVFTVKLPLAAEQSPPGGMDAEGSSPLVLAKGRESGSL